jgi:hypothetical protein
MCRRQYPRNEMDYKLEREDDSTYQGGNNQLNLRLRGQYPRNEMDYELEREKDIFFQGGNSQ